MFFLQCHLHIICINFTQSASTRRLPEAAFFCRTYAPSRMPPVVAAWKADLTKQVTWLSILFAVDVIFLWLAADSIVHQPCIASRPSQLTVERVRQYTFMMAHTGTTQCVVGYESLVQMLWIGWLVGS